MNPQVADDIRRHGIEYVFQRFYGAYRAVAYDTADPAGRGRVRAFVPGAGQAEASATWINPTFFGAGDNRGFFWPPEVGDPIHVSFDNGDPDAPGTYVGGFNPADAVPAEFRHDGVRPQVRGLITRGGHRLVFDDTPGSEKVSLVWHARSSSDPSVQDASKSADRASGRTTTLLVTPAGSVEVTTAAGIKLTLDDEAHEIRIEHPSGPSLLVASDRVEIQGGASVKVVATRVEVEADEVSLGRNASHSVVRGEVLAQYLGAHTHPTPSGPSGPAQVTSPVPPGILSAGVKVS